MLPNTKGPPLTCSGRASQKLDIQKVSFFVEELRC